MLRPLIIDGAAKDFVHRLLHDDPFLAELRRAVTDPEPLGPRDHEPLAAPFDDTQDDASGGRFRLRRGR